MDFFQHFDLRRHKCDPVIQMWSTNVSLWPAPTKNCSQQ